MMPGKNRKKIGLIFAPVCTILNLVAQLSAKKRGTRVYGRYYYSGVFARYCELLYSYYQDDALSIIDSYKWALGDIDGDGTNILFYSSNIL